MIKDITSFSQIEYIKPNSLVVLDIDETILTFSNINREWWDKTYNNFLHLYKNKDEANKQSEILWANNISKNTPIILDNVNLHIFLEKASENKCELIFLTARNKNISDLTMKQLNYCGINIDASKVFYNRDKGSELKNILENIFPNINHIIFIDDIINNLINVKSKITLDLELYNIKHNN